MSSNENLDYLSLGISSIALLKTLGTPSQTVLVGSDPAPTGNLAAIQALTAGNGALVRTLGGIWSFANGTSDQVMVCGDPPIFGDAKRIVSAGGGTPGGPDLSNQVPITGSRYLVAQYSSGFNPFLGRIYFNAAGWLEYAYNCFFNGSFWNSDLNTQSSSLWVPGSFNFGTRMLFKEPTGVGWIDDDWDGATEMNGGFKQVIRKNPAAGSIQFGRYTYSLFSLSAAIGDSIIGSINFGADLISGLAGNNPPTTFIADTPLQNVGFDFGTLTVANITNSGALLSAVTTASGRVFLYGEMLVEA